MTWFSGHVSDGLTVGLHGLSGLFQLNDSMVVQKTRKGGNAKKSYMWQATKNGVY